MTRSVPRFLGCLVVMVMTGAGLILAVPALANPEAATPLWVPAVLTVLFSVSAFLGWSVRPREDDGAHGR